MALKCYQSKWCQKATKVNGTKVVPKCYQSKWYQSSTIVNGTKVVPKYLPPNSNEASDKVETMLLLYESIRVSLCLHLHKDKFTSWEKKSNSLLKIINTVIQIHEFLSRFHLHCKFRKSISFYWCYKTLCTL